MQKNIPFSKETIQSIIAKYPTPFHIYDERAMIENAKNLQKAFQSPQQLSFPWT